MEYRKIGSFIREVNQRNSTLSCLRLQGVNIKKQFMDSVANKQNLDLSKYKLVRKGQFAYNPMHVARDIILPIALHDQDEPIIVSPAYVIFEVVETAELLPEYLMSWLKRSETDRHLWYFTDASIRGGLGWEEFCNLELPYPSIDGQREISSLLCAVGEKIDLLQRQIKALERIKELSLQPYIPARDEYKPLGDYIRELDNRNSDLACSNLLGVSIKKEFMDSKSDKSTLNLASYKLVEPRQFSYVTVTSRNGEKISIALNENETGLVSSTYVTFEVIDEEKLIPEYLLLWFKRKEFDRYARYHSWGSARETFDWVDMCNVELPVPPIEEQRKIVAVFKAYTEKKTATERTLKNRCEAP